MHALNTYWAHVRRLESRHAAISTQVYPNRAQEVTKECLPTRRWPTTELHKQCACARSLAQRATPTAPSRGTCGTAYPDRARPASAVEPETGDTPTPPNSADDHLTRQYTGASAVDTVQVAVRPLTAAVIARGLCAVRTWCGDCCLVWIVSHAHNRALSSACSGHSSRVGLRLRECDCSPAPRCSAAPRPRTRPASVGCASARAQRPRCRDCPRCPPPCPSAPSPPSPSTDPSAPCPARTQTRAPSVRVLNPTVQPL